MTGRPRTFVFLSQVYVPDPAAVGQHLADAAEELVRRGQTGFAFASQYSWPQLVAGLHRRAAAAAPELAGLAPPATAAPRKPAPVLDLLSVGN